MEIQGAMAMKVLCTVSLYVSPLPSGKYEVTFAEWDACVSGGGCNGYRPDDRGWGRGNRPVINVRGEDATSYTSWLSRKTGHSYRLPSEAEWEYAARAGTTTRYHVGNTLNENEAKYGGAGMTNSVGSFPPNAFGLHDVHGNVSELVGDCWHKDFTGAPSDTKVWRGGDCSRRVYRGGSWGEIDPKFLRSANRRYGNAYSGFRIASAVPLSWDNVSISNNVSIPNNAPPSKSTPVSTTLDPRNRR